MEVRIGVQHSPREVVLQVDTTADKLMASITKAWKAGDILTLEDVKGRRVMVSPDRLAFIELGPEEERRVGFGAD